MPLDSSFDGFSCKAANFKCFGSEPQGFDEIKPINVIIGRNNSGKSALLVLIQHLTVEFKSFPKSYWHARSCPRVILGGIVTEHVARQAFPEDRWMDGLEDFANPWMFGRYTVGTRLKWERGGQGYSESIVAYKYSSDALDRLARLKVGLDERFARNLVAGLSNPLEKRGFRRVSAERDIISEVAKAELNVSATGNGATNIIQNYINQQSLDHDLVEGQLLSAINHVLAPDACFTAIRCHQIGDKGPWEIHLEEEHKGRIALSESGSGLKTVMLVLINLLLVPKSEEKPLSSYVFAFEELENNLHPSLLRRLLLFIREQACKEKFPVFLTTHSSAMIDLFARDKDAQIVHVRHDGKSATATTANTYIDNKGVLDDLDVRASDLLQANSIIWVEGPSDRIYLNHWIWLWSEGKLKEGTHYQCVFYGGRLLAHLDAGSPDDAGSGIPILQLARHACVVIDSDKREEQTPVNGTKRRIEKEITSMGGMAWVTQGREIENYIPNAAFETWRSGLKLDERAPYEDVFEALDKMEPGLGKRYRDKKPQLAEAIVPHITKENSAGMLDLDNQVTELVRRIREWNQLRD